MFTCFDVPDVPFPTAGHPWSTDPHHQDVADRLLLNRHVRYYGDDVCVVVAENEGGRRPGRTGPIRVEYEELPFVLDVQEAMKPDAPQIQENFPGNILGHTSVRKGDYKKAIQEPGLIKVEGWYDTPRSSTVTSKTTSVTPRWRRAVLLSPPPPRSPTSSAASSVRP